MEAMSVGVVNARHCSAATSRAAAVKARPRRAFLDFRTLLRVKAVTFMGNARQVAAVCIRAPSFSIPYPRQVVGGQTAARTIVLISGQIKGADKAACQEYKCTPMSR